MPMQTLTVTDVISLFLDPAAPTGSFPADVTFIGRNFSDVGDLSVTDGDLGTGTLTINITPEPGSLALLTGLCLTVAGFARKSRNRS